MTVVNPQPGGRSRRTEPTRAESFTAAPSQKATSAATSSGSMEAEAEVVVVGEEVRFGAGGGNWAIKFNHLLNKSSNRYFVC